MSFSLTLTDRFSRKIAVTRSRPALAESVVLLVDDLIMLTASFKYTGEFASIAGRGTRMMVVTSLAAAILTSS